jgi:hypothetical protein
VNSAINQSSSQAQTPAKPNKSWGVAISILTLLIWYKVTWPLHFVAMVYWVYGKAGYTEQGIRVLKTRPLRFSNGQLVPPFVETVLGISTLVVACIVGGLLIGVTYRLYAWTRAHRRSHAA